MYQAVRNVLFALSRNDAEQAHTLALRVISQLQRVPALISFIAWYYEAVPAGYQKPVYICPGLTLLNQVGLAAGLDKQGQMLPFLQALGFGFITVGTVLPRPQAGNPRPRIFRLPEHEAIINRLGFNSDGVGAVVPRLRAALADIEIPIGVSAGKMRDTPLQEAATDYILVMQKVWALVDYIELCISSPNTPDLRKLQGRDYMEDFLTQIAAARRDLVKLLGCDRPILLKIAPDLTLAEVDDILAAIGRGSDCLVDGLIISNTTNARPSVWEHPHGTQAGGLSGAPVYPLMLDLLRHVRKQNGGIPIIAVGGINNRLRASTVLDIGANAIQILTPLIYQGPKLIHELRAA